MNKTKEVLFKMLYHKNGDDVNPTDGELLEAISELEQLQQRSCEGCKHVYKYGEYHTYFECGLLIYLDSTTNEIVCLDVDKDFCCNRYEPKEQL